MHDIVSSLEGNMVLVQNRTPYASFETLPKVCKVLVGQVEVVGKLAFTHNRQL